MLLPRNRRRARVDLQRQGRHSSPQTRAEDQQGDESEEADGGQDETQVLPDVGDGHSAYGIRTSAVSSKSQHQRELDDAQLYPGAVGVLSKDIVVRIG
ncbi:hypothetical protein LTR12_009466 [Friedmanniomyces endolithicus]|nr:hypothetical protein LTR74_002469 [Friedmanniomyces endolithicus]KAK1816126.1 hypothetical protein LTR12_009466 [Friedmanniomyces endolithicus]